VIVRQPETGFRAGLDAVMLAAAVPDGATALELGAGAGTASLCLAARLPSIAITGIEIDRESFGRSTVFFSRTRCPICRADHAWFAREAWVDEPGIRVRPAAPAALA